MPKYELEFPIDLNLHGCNGVTDMVLDFIMEESLLVNIIHIFIDRIHHP